MARGRVYPYSCPDCGREVRAEQAWAARHRGPCLGCLRVRNGWQHRPDCSEPPWHKGLCAPAIPAGRTPRSTPV